MYTYVIIDFRYKTRRDPDVALVQNDPYVEVYRNLPTSHHVLRKVPNCEYCGAIRFPGEGSGFCCRQGKVNIFIPGVPNNLRILFTSQTDRDALYFWNNIRYFNSHFSFTSFGATVDQKLATASGVVLLDIYFVQYHVISFFT